MANLNKNFELLVQRDFDTKQTIQVLQHKKQIYWSWGVEKLVNYYDKGLILIVNAHHHKGLLFIRLSWDDTYSYYILNDDNSIKKEVHNVYFDELQQRVDKDIEFINEYK